MHLPTVKYDCDDIIDVMGDDIVDALTLGEDMKQFCSAQEQCLRHEEL